MTVTTGDGRRGPLLREHADIQLPGVESALRGDPVFHAVSPEDLLVLTVRGAQLPDHFLERVYAFRLIQYLRRGWVDAAAVADCDLRHEPYDEQALLDFHTLVLERETGWLRGYGTLAVSPDPAGTTLGDPSHLPFVVERDYGMRLAATLGARTPSSAVREGKRLVRDAGMPRSHAAATVPWWVYLAWAAACTEVLDRPGGTVVGDGKKSGAVHQLGLLGFRVRTLDVAPLPPGPSDLYAPMWNQRERSYPFLLTDDGRLRPTLDHLTALLMSEEPVSIRARLTRFLETSA
ncbi:hypothetical protein ACFUCH_24420 [Streptomyces olivaceus]|uniref:hypothetical protein n=1 Tax=Streptomyces olivaceus TaxID=47716 RepID=UPI0036393E86